MKLWIDDVRPAPNKEYFWVQSVNEAKNMIKHYIDYWNNVIPIDLDHDVGAKVTDGGDYIKLLDKAILIDLDHDAGDYASDGGDYIKLLDWLESEGYVDEKFTFHIHSMNPVGIQNMRAIIQKNGWQEV